MKSKFVLAIPVLLGAAILGIVLCARTLKGHSGPGFRPRGPVTDLAPRSTSPWSVSDRLPEMGSADPEGGHRLPSLAEERIPPPDVPSLRTPAYAAAQTDPVPPDWTLPPEVYVNPLEGRTPEQ